VLEADVEQVLHGAVFGTLFRALVDGAMAGAVSASPPSGDYDPPYGRGEWPRVLEPVWNRMHSYFGDGDSPPVGEMSEQELDALFEVLASESVLRAGDRLVLFGEPAQRAVDVAEWQRFIDMVAPRLPERVGVVVSRPPEGLGWDEDPHFLLLEDVPVEGPETFRFRLSALRGDQPASVDLLGLGRFADALARFVLLPETDPLTIGIHGPWGKGKSSFMTLVDAALHDSARDGPPVVSTWFNAWRYEDATQTWAGLASTISRAIEGALPRRRRIWSPIALRVAHASPAVHPGPRRPDDPAGGRSRDPPRRRLERKLGIRPVGGNMGATRSCRRARDRRRRAPGLASVRCENP
jgi:hypothetical protein